MNAANYANDTEKWLRVIAKPDFTKSQFRRSIPTNQEKG